jgi:hypothetical protein
MTDILSLHEIVTSLHDSGVIDKGTAQRLEQRMTAWAGGQKADGMLSLLRRGVAEDHKRIIGII